MQILNTLLSKILGFESTFTSPQPAATGNITQAAQSNIGNVEVASPRGEQVVNVPGSTPSSIAAASNYKTEPVKQVDVASKLDNLAAKSKEKLNWKTSIVDLLKLVGMDSSLDARKNLAKELHYSGDISDSATMNIWLHQEVLTKISENGGALPSDLRAH